MKNYKSRYNNIKFKIKEPILDIGGNDGSFLLYLGIKKAEIIDFTDKKNNVENFKFINSDLRKGIKLNKKYKTIFLMEVLEHLPNPLYLMADVYDLLEDDGRIYISVPWTRNYNFGYNPKKRKGFGRHLSRWKLKELIKEMKRLGFKVKILKTKKRYKGLGFWLPHSWIVLELIKDNQIFER